MSAAPISDTALVAYHHRRLPADAAAEIERALETDAALKARYAGLAKEIEFLSGLLNASLAPPRQDIERQIRAAITPPKARRIAMPVPAPKDWSVSWRSLAASVLVAAGIGLAVGMMGSPGEEESAEGPQLHALEEARADSRQAALEFASSGTAELRVADDQSWKVEVTPIRTFRNVNGAFCREFIEIWQVAGSTRGEVGVACREREGRWRDVANLPVH